MGLTVDVLQDLDLHDLQAAARAALQENNAIALIELLEMMWSCEVEGANAVIDAVLQRLQQLRALR
jgi:translation elongation factor EF-G